jgi:hypothetical protein
VRGRKEKGAPVRAPARVAPISLSPYSLLWCVHIYIEAVKEAVSESRAPYSFCRLL